MIKLRHLIIENEEPSIEMADLIRMAKSKGYIHQTFRGDIDAGEIFNYTPKERREYGIFTTPYKEVAAIYAGSRKPASPRRFFVRAEKILDLTKDSLQNMKWVNTWGEGFDEWHDPQSGEEITPWEVLEGGRLFDYEGDWSSNRWKDIQQTAHNYGYDVVILPDYDSNVGIFPSMVVFDEKNLKLADLVTYDDHNQPIPLDQRFNKITDDIRY